MKQARQSKIIRFLLRSNQYHTIQDIANHVGVSNRTIRHDLDAIAPMLNSHSLQLIKKTGSGIMIKGSDQAKLTFETQNVLPDSMTQSFSPKERQTYIALRILSNGPTRVMDLLDELYVSKATLQKDINEVKNCCDAFQIRLNRNGTQGLSITGKERKIRNFMFDLMISTDTFLNFEQYIQDLSHPCNGSMIFPGLDLTDDEIVAGLKPILSHNHYPLEDYTTNTLSHLMVRLLIVCIRSNMENYANLSDKFITELNAYPEAFETSQYLLQEQAFLFLFDIELTDIYYLQIYVVAYQHGTTLSSDNEEHIQEFVRYLIQYWSDHTAVTLTSDKQLYNDLLTHMNAVDIRINYGIPIKNPLMEDIDIYYSNTYNLLVESINHLDNSYWKQLSVDELGYITLYLAGAVERHKSKLRTLLVTEIGRSAHSVLTQRIAFNIPELDIVQSVMSHQVATLQLEHFDLILTTNPKLTNTQVPVIHIGQLITDHDLIRLKEFVRPIFKDKNSPKREP